MEACRLLEPVSDGKPKPCRVRALGVNFRDRFVVKLAQRVENPARLLRLIADRTEVVDDMPGEQPGKLGKADHARSFRQVVFDVLRAFLRGLP